MFFCDLVFINFFDIFGIIHEYFGKKTWKPFVVFMKVEKKVETWRPLVVFMKWETEINWNHLVPRLGLWKFDGGRRRPSASSNPSANFHGPSLGTRWFQFISFSHFMKPPKPSRFQLIFLSTFMKPQMVSSFLAKNTRETTKNIKKIVETRSQKKCAVSL